jgi:hypothetical protein
VKKTSIQKIFQKKSNKKNENQILKKINHGGWNCKKKSKKRYQTKQIAIKKMGIKFER